MSVSLRAPLAVRGVEVDRGDCGGGGHAAYSCTEEMINPV